jgi:GNAT superfamily N-acetyltransferase
MRFFYRMRSFSHEVVQKHWASMDYHKNMSIIGLVQKGGHKEIVAIGTYAYDREQVAEIAFVVREDYQSMGIASYLLEVLEQIAKENSYTHFQASVLRENSAMIQVFRKRYPDLKIVTQSGNEVLVEMNLSNSKEVHVPALRKP